MVILRIKQVAESRGIHSAADLQKAMETHPAQAHKLWEGDLRMIALSTIDLLCYALSCSPGDLFDYAPGSAMRRPPEAGTGR